MNFDFCVFKVLQCILLIILNITRLSSVKSYSAKYICSKRVALLRKGLDVSQNMSYKILKCRQSKGNNSSITNYNRRNFTCITTLRSYILYKFHEVPSIANHAMAEDREIIEI